MRAFNVSAIAGFAAAAAIFTGGAASAATFNLTSGYTAVPGGYQYTVDGITLTITAGGFADNATGNVTSGQGGARPYIYSPGVGISYNGDNSHTIDGSGQNDVLILTFSENVVIDSITFGYFDSNDDFDFFYDSDTNGTLNRVLNNVDIPNSGVALLASLFTQSGAWFGIGADGNDDSFKLKSVSVSVVPLPAAAPFFIAGAGALGFFRRKAKKKTA